MPTETRNAPDAHWHGTAFRIWAGCRGDRGLSATAPACQPLSRDWNASQLTPNQRHIHLVEVKYCKDARPRSMLEAANQQHSVLYHHLCRATANASLHAILPGVCGTIYTPYSTEPLEDLSLNPQIATKLAMKLHAHFVQYAYKLVSTRRALEKAYVTSHHQGMGFC